jgi:hypothetical protein
VLNNWHIVKAYPKKYYIYSMKYCKNKILELISKGYTQSEIAKEFNTSVRSITVCCNHHKIKNPNKSKKISFSPIEKQVVLGSLLGDGTITKDGRLRIKHSYKQKDYLIYKKSLLSNIEYNFRDVKSTYDKRTDKNYNHVNLDTKVYQNFKDLRHNWYPDGVKNVYIKDFKEINALGIAIWFMDDGFKSNKGIMIATDSFKKEDLVECCKILYEKFNIRFMINNKNRIYLKKTEYSKFYQLVKPYIHSTMLYKLITLNN